MKQLVLTELAQTYWNIVCTLSLFHPLCYLFNLSLFSGTIPSEWKIHLITSVYKSADRSCISNYRRISFLCNTSNVLESLMYDNIIDHVSAIISPYQFGFLSGRSTIQQLLLFFHHDLFMMLSLMGTKLMLSIWIYVRHSTVYLIANCLVSWGISAFLVICGTGFIVIFQITRSISVLIVWYPISYLLFLVCPKGVSLARYFL